MSRRAPALFISHGAPNVLVERGPWQTAIEMIGREYKPRAVIVMSAHWRSRVGFEIANQPTFETIHDFSGFAEELKRFAYPAKGDEDIAQQCVDLIQGAAMTTRLEKTRGLDHGAYVPLHFLYPKYDVPVIPIAISARATPQEIFRVGEILAPLRNDGVMIIGSGGMVHNLGELTWEQPSEIKADSWAQDFEGWVMTALMDRDFAALCDFSENAPHAKKAHPTTEHFAPLFFTAGAVSAWGEEVEEIYRGWAYKNLSMTCVGFGLNLLN